jgi:ribosomal-protein-alanine N-acetyltransferase
MVALYGDPEVATWLGRPAMDRGQALERLERHIDHQRRHGFSVWAVVEKESGEVVGHCGLQHLDEGPEIEVGWALLPSRWGRGYATEAARAALAYGFGELGLHEIVAVTRPDNLRSQRVMQKLGMTYEGRAVYYGVQQVKYSLSRGTGSGSSQAGRTSP